MSENGVFKWNSFNISTEILETWWSLYDSLMYKVASRVTDNEYLYHSNYHVLAVMKLQFLIYDLVANIGF